MSGHRKADVLNSYAYFAGDAGFIDKDLERYRAVNLDGMRTSAQKTLGPGRVIVTVSPRSASAAKESK
jgi:hypothetical protein